MVHFVCVFVDFLLPEIFFSIRLKIRELWGTLDLRHFSDQKKCLLVPWKIL